MHKPYFWKSFFCCMPSPCLMNPRQVKTDQALQFFKVNVSFSQAFLSHAIKNPLTSRPWSKSVFSNKQKIAMEELRVGPKQKTMTFNSFGQKLNSSTLYKSNSRKGFIWREREKISVIWQKQPLFTCDAWPLGAARSKWRQQPTLFGFVFAGCHFSHWNPGRAAWRNSFPNSGSLFVFVIKSLVDFFFFFWGGGNNKYTLDIRDDTPSEILRLVPSGEQRGKLKKQTGSESPCHHLSVGRRRETRVALAATADVHVEGNQVTRRHVCECPLGK